MAQHAWFRDPLFMSSPIPWYLSNLLSQPFNQTPHRNLSNLDLHALLLEPLQSRSRVSSKAVAVGIEAPQRGSTRSVIADNWVIYQSIHHNRILLVFWTVYRDRPTGWRGIPSWNLPLVLHQLARLH